MYTKTHQKQKGKQKDLGIKYEIEHEISLFSI